jgi:hypothetical protein
MKQIKLFQLDRRVRKFYYTTEPACCQRLSNNSEPKFTDIQAITINLYGLNLGFRKKLDIYNFAKQYLLRYCKHLPTYKQFCVRINKLAPVFEMATNAALQSKAKTSKTHLLDSAPIVVAKGRRDNIARTASELCNKGYCASQKMWYYGVKIHVLAEERPNTLPVPRQIMLTKASASDLNTAKIMLENAEDTEVIADKAYIDQAWGYDLQLRYVQLLTQFKERSKNQLPLDDGEHAWNAMISSRRQQIESLFSQISRLTDMQDAHVARSENGLLSFIWARCALLAFFYW